MTVVSCNCDRASLRDDELLEIVISAKLSKPSKCNECHGTLHFKWLKLSGLVYIYLTIKGIKVETKTTVGLQSESQHPTAAPLV